MLLIKKACIHWFSNIVEVVGQDFIFVKKKEKPVRHLYLKEGASFSIPCILAHFVSFACNVSGYKQESKKDKYHSSCYETDSKNFFLETSNRRQYVEPNGYTTM